MRRCEREKRVKVRKYESVKVRKQSVGRRKLRLLVPPYWSWWAQPTLQGRLGTAYWAIEEKLSQTAKAASMASGSESAEASGPLWP